MKLLCVLIMLSRSNLTKVIDPGLLRLKHRVGPLRRKGTEHTKIISRTGHWSVHFSFIIENSNLFSITVISKNFHSSFQYHEIKHFFPSFIIIKTINYYLLLIIYYLLFINLTPFHNHTISLDF